MTKTVWHSGPPPSLGWWPASDSLFNGVYRWWNGHFWSHSAMKHDSIEHVSWAAKEKSVMPGIKWRNRPSNWPERSKT